MAGAGVAVAAAGVAVVTAAVIVAVIAVAAVNKRLNWLTNRFFFTVLTYYRTLNGPAARGTVL